MLNLRKKPELIRMVKRVLSGNATQEEKSFVERYYNYFNKKEFDPTALSDSEKELLEEKILKNIRQQIDDPRDKRFLIFLKKRPFQVAAASLLVLISVYVLYRYVQSASLPGPAIQSDSYAEQDVPPGGNKAVLTLADGSQVILDSAGNGNLATQQGAKIIKIDAGQLIYSAAGNTNDAGQTSSSGTKSIQYNTLSTPRGGQYQIKLGDGSTVWLNSASSLTFPTIFHEKHRQVTLTGEAYFEIAKHTNQPFIVKIDDVEVEVLGTHFNIMAYPDEPAVKASLLEGSVKVIRSGTSALLNPGQQAVLGNTAGKIEVKPANMEEVIAWKNGLFSFNGTDVHQVMRQISRWYNVDVEYKDSLKIFLNGNISRDEKVSEVFKMLELAGELHFTIRDRKVIISKN